MCEGEFHPPALEGSYIKPKILVDCLVQIFYRGVKDISKYTSSIAMLREMDTKRCDDGSRFFLSLWRGRDDPTKSGECKLKTKACGCNGALLSLGQVQAWVSQTAARSKRARGAREGE
jgi:hypothetical protein